MLNVFYSFRVSITRLFIIFRHRGIVKPGKRFSRPFNRPTLTLAVPSHQSGYARRCPAVHRIGRTKLSGQENTVPSKTERRVRTRALIERSVAFFIYTSVKSNAVYYLKIVGRLSKVASVRFRRERVV